MNVTARLQAYAEDERDRFEIKHNNLFVASVQHAATFGIYLDLVVERYAAVSIEYATRMRRHFDSMKAGTPEPWDWREGYALQTRVHLEIETFYLLAKIFVDRLAMHVQQAWGPARGCSLQSHHGLIHDLEAYARDRGLTVPTAALFEKARTVREKISDYRDDEIAHAKNSRVSRGTTLGPDGRVAIGSGMLYPTERDDIEGHSSLTPPELGALLDDYVAELVAYLRVNIPRAKGFVTPSAVPAPSA